MIVSNLQPEVSPLFPSGFILLKTGGVLADRTPGVASLALDLAVL
jgi:hypothetical protein